MVVNVDVSNAVFWNEQSLMNAARELTGAGSYADLANKSQPIRTNINAPISESPAMVQMRKLRKNEFTVRHKGRTQKERKFNSISFLPLHFVYYLYMSDNPLWSSLPMLIHYSRENLEGQSHCGSHTSH